MRPGGSSLSTASVARCAGPVMTPKIGIVDRRPARIGGDHALWSSVAVAPPFGRTPEALEEIVEPVRHARPGLDCERQRLLPHQAPQRVFRLTRVLGALDPAAAEHTRSGASLS